MYLKLFDISRKKNGVVPNFYNFRSLSWRLKRPRLSLLQIQIKFDGLISILTPISPNQDYDHITWEVG